jgi:Asp-tRNA(Asn)/Glu-tRNA(Gln) amidotransferase C subunit
MQSLDRAVIEQFGRMVHVHLPEDRIGLVAERLAELFTMAAELDRMPLEGVPPAMTYRPEWPEEESV